MIRIIWFLRRTWIHRLFSLPYRMQDLNKRKKNSPHHDYTEPVDRHWTDYANTIDMTILSDSKFSINSPLNTKWLNLRHIIKNTAFNTFNKKKVSNTWGEC